MFLFFLFSLLHFSFCYSTIHADRFIQYQTDSNSTTVGSSRSTIDHVIGKFDSKPNSNNAVFVPLESADFQSVVNHINATSPVVFLVGQKPINTSQLEDFLLSSGHKAPIYFAYDTATVPNTFTHVMTSGSISNSAIKKAKLQNIIGTINSSRSFDHEKIAVITAPFDSFSTVPSAKVGANNNGLSLAAFLETMHLVSKFPMTNNWVFVFALTDGHFCNFEGLEKAVSTLSRDHGAKIKFAISLESIASKNVQGLFSMKLKRGSAFAKFMECLIDAFKTANVDFTFGLSEEDRTQSVFAKHKIQSIAIMNSDNDELSRVTDFIPDVERSDSVAWAVSEALLRMMYDADNTAAMVERKNVDTTYWANIVSSFTRMPQFRDQTASQVLAQWMAKFAQVTNEEWSSNKCRAVYSGTAASLILYNPTPLSANVALFVAAFVYGALVFVVVAGVQKVKGYFSK